MKKISIVLTSFITLVMLVSCCSTTFVDENKKYSFKAGKGNNSVLHLVDETLYSQGKSENGDSFYSYYTKSQRKYDLFELGLIGNTDVSEQVSEPQIELYCGNYEADSWKLMTRCTSASYSASDNTSLPLFFVKPNSKNYIPGMSDDKAINSEDFVSCRVYIKKYSGDYKITYTTKSGEEITSYFVAVK